MKKIGIVEVFRANVLKFHKITKFRFQNQFEKIRLERYLLFLLDKVRPTTATHGRITFVAAKQKQISDKVASRTRRRGQVKIMSLKNLQ